MFILYYDWSKGMNKYLKRESNVELLRIFACFMVIATHIKLSTQNELGQLINGRTLISCMVGVGVTIFFMITGFFLYNAKKSFCATLKQTFMTIVVPFIVYLFVSPIVLPYCLGEKSIFQSLLDFNINVRNVFQVFTWSNMSISYGGHLWYIFSYLEVILFLPLIRLVCTDDKNAVKVRRYFIALGLISKFLDDAQKIMSLEYGIVRLYNPLTMPIVITLIGFELYKQRKNIMGNIKYRIIALCVFCVGNVGSVALLKYAALKGITTRVASYDSIWPMFLAIAFAIFVLSFEIKNEFIRKTINYVSSHTYWIYLVHMLVVTKFYTRGVRAAVLELTVSKFPGFVGEVLYTAIYTLLVFGGSMCVSMVIRYGIKLLKFICMYFKNMYIKAVENVQSKKSSGIKWAIRCLVIAVILVAECVCYRYKYVQEIVGNSERGRVYELSGYTSEQIEYISAKEIKQKIKVDTRNGLSGFGIKVFYDGLNEETHLRMVIEDEKQCLLDEKINLNQLNNGDFWQCFFENDVEKTLDGYLTIFVTGDYENVKIQCLSLGENSDKAIIDGETSESTLYLIKNESTQFVKETSDIYCVMIGIVTIIVMVGIFIEEDMKHKDEDSDEE